MTTVAKSVPYSTVLASLLLRCNKRLLPAQQAALHLRCEQTLSLSSCPEAPLLAKPGDTRGKEAAGAPTGRGKCFKPRAGQRASRLPPPSLCEPLRPQPGRSGRGAGTRRPCPSAFTLHLGAALGPERIGDRSRCALAAAAASAPPGCRARYKYPRHRRAAAAAPPAGQGDTARHGTATGTAASPGCGTAPCPRAAFAAKSRGCGSRCLGQWACSAAPKGRAGA